MLRSFRARSFMASDAICQFGQHRRVILEACTVTAQTPTHIHFLRLSNRHLPDLSVTVLAVETGCNMRTMAVVDKIREKRHRYPRNGFVAINVRRQFIQFGTGFGDILVTAITLGNGGQPGRLSPQCSRVAV